MDNKTNKKNNNISKNINPFKRDFSNSQYQNNINNKELDNNIPQNYIKDNETILQTKMRQQLNNNGRNSIFISGNDMNKPEFRESLKSMGILLEPKDEFLCLRKMPKISQEAFNDMQNSIIDRNSLTNFYMYLQTINCNFNSISQFESIGGMCPLTYLIESSFDANINKAKEMYNKYNILSPYIYSYRLINRDGNCYYRAVMFRYLEILILSNNIEYLQNIIYDIVNCFNSQELQSRRIIRNIDVKPELTFKILILIVDLLKNEMIQEAHQILVKSFSTSQKFDYAIILYFRYILYDYIKNNENKVYLKSFPIKIGNLLPNQYETQDGEFLFNTFYEKYLLNFFTDAEKIIVYLTPFVLGIELNVIIFDDNEDEVLKKFKWEGNSELQFNDVIRLLNNKNHYEIIYTPQDYEKNKWIYQIYENNQKAIILNNIKKKINLDESNFNILADSSKDININKDMDKNNENMVYKKNLINNIKSNQIINNKNNKNNNNNNNNNNNYNNNNQENRINCKSTTIHDMKNQKWGNILRKSNIDDFSIIDDIRKATINDYNNLYHKNEYSNNVVYSNNCFTISQRPSKSCEPKLNRNTKKQNRIKKNKYIKKGNIIEKSQNHNYKKINIYDRKDTKTPSKLSNNIYSIINTSHMNTDSEKSQIKITPKFHNKSEDKMLKKNKKKTRNIKTNNNKISTTKNDRMNKSFDYNNNLVRKNNNNENKKRLLKANINAIKINDNKNIKNKFNNNNYNNYNNNQRKCYNQYNNNIAKKITYDEYFGNNDNNNSILEKLKQMKSKLEKSMLDDD